MIKWDGNESVVRDSARVRHAKRNLKSFWTQTELDAVCPTDMILALFRHVCAMIAHTHTVSTLIGLSMRSCTRTHAGTHKRKTYTLQTKIFQIAEKKSSTRRMFSRAGRLQSQSMKVLMCRWRVIKQKEIGKILMVRVLNTTYYFSDQREYFPRHNAQSSLTHSHTHTGFDQHQHHISTSAAAIKKRKERKKLRTVSIKMRQSGAAHSFECARQLRVICGAWARALTRAKSWGPSIRLASHA